MLFILKQLAKAQSYIISNSFAGGEAPRSNDIGGRLENSKKILKDFLISLDKNNDKFLTTQEIADEEAKKIVKGLVESLAGGHNFDKDGIGLTYLIGRIEFQRGEYAHVLERYANEVQRIRQVSHEDLTTLREETGKTEAEYRAMFKRTLQKGTTGADVKLLQEFLIRKTGVSASKVNMGTFDSETYTMLWNYQSQNGLGADGIAGGRTFDKVASDMFAENAPAVPVARERAQTSEFSREYYRGKFTRTLKRDMKGADVRELQEFLLKSTKMFDQKELTMGTFDGATYTMLWNYQNKNGLSRDGIAGGKTFDKIADEMYKNQATRAPQRPQGQAGQNPQQNPDQPYKTMEDTDGRINITAGFGKEDYAGLRENINTESYEHIIKNMNYDQLKAFYADIMNVSNQYYKKGNEYVYNWGSLSKICDLFEKKYNYKPDGVFGGIEVASLVTLVGAVYRTQERVIQSNDWKAKMALVFDYNQDGLLDSDVHFYTEELQFFKAVETKREFNNLLSNLGFSSIADFEAQLKNNYFRTREKFKTALGIALSAPEILEPGVMLEDPNALKNFNEFVARHRERIKNGVNEAVDTHEKTKNLPKETKDLIKFQAAGLIIGARSGIMASLDISELTNGILDTLSFGMVHGIPGIGIAKRIYVSENGRLKVDLGAINFIPYVAAEGVIKEANIGELKRIFQNEIPASTQVSLTGVVSPVGVSIMGGVDIASKGTKLGMEQARKEMGKTLDKVFDDIKAGKTFEKSSFGKDPTNKDYYEILAGLYRSNGGNDMAIDRLKDGALQNYARVLHQNASNGIHLSKIKVGILMYVVGWMPFGNVTFETHSGQWVSRDTFNVTGGNVTDYYKENIDYGNVESLTEKAEQYKDLFDSETRKLKGALALLQPNNKVGVRWAGLVEMVGNMKPSAKKTELQNFLKTIKKDGDKGVLISTYSQLTKRARDYRNGDIKNWNENTTNLINIDRNRRKGFNTEFGFNTDTYAETVYGQLEKGKGKIGEATLMGLAFDATSTINVEGNKAVKGTDVLLNPTVLTVNGQPVLVEITNQSHIDAFIARIQKMPNLTKATKEAIAKGLKNGELKMNFGKDPEGFDDRIYLTSTKPVKNIRVYGYEPHTTEWSLFGVPGVKRWNDNNDDSSTPPRKDGQESKPGAEQGSNQSSGPGAIQNPGTETGGR